ncbi:MAG: serine/threonine protein kinase [Cognaticolwellia sp.]|jgi:serine/threonine protein kinase
MLEPGQIIERYRILRVLGQGGMAVVYAAQHIELGSLHAIKVLMITTQHLRDRALQEGRIQAGLNHPNIVSVSDVIRLQGAPALVMELVRGPSLEGYLHEVRPTFNQIDSLARGVLEGLVQVHHSGRIHRDLKPANVLLAVENGAVVAKLADFGLAKILSGDGLSHSRTGVTMGTPAYMAPEQFRDAKNVDKRADIFSVGVLLYELCTGAMPYPSGEAGDMISLFRAIEAGQYVRPSKRVLDLPMRMERAISKALHADPEHRHDSVEELMEAWCDGRPVPIRPWSAKQAAELLLMGPEIPTPELKKSPSLRSATQPAKRPRAAVDLPMTDSLAAADRPISDSGAAEAWEHISQEQPAAPELADAPLLPEGQGGNASTPAQGPVTLGLEPAPRVTPTPEWATQAPSKQGAKSFLVLGAVAVALVLLVGLWVKVQEPDPALQPAAVALPDVPVQELEPIPVPQDEAVVALVEDPRSDPVGKPAREKSALVSERAKVPEQLAKDAPPAPVLEAPPVKEPTGSVAASATDANDATSLRLQGVDRGYVVDLKGKQKRLGVLVPGKYKVYAFFDASKATQVLEVDLKEGQRVVVSCDAGMRMCRAK